MLKYEITKDKEEKFTLTVINQKRMGTKKVPWKCLGAGMTEAECRKKQVKIDGLMKTLSQSKKPAQTKDTSTPLGKQPTTASKKYKKMRAKEYVAKMVGF